MTQAERRLWLITYLLGEDGRYQGVQIPKDSEEQFCLYRSLVNVRMPAPVSEEYLKTEDAFLKEETLLKGVTSASSLRFDDDIAVWQGDITTLACDAIVNAANSRLLGCFCPCHACIDNCIHTFAGVRLRLKCGELMEAQGVDEPTGRAKITPAYNLPCRYVLHTVGPIVYGELTEQHREQLASCYEECLKRADEYGLSDIAFCCISTGEFRFPNGEAARIAVRTVRDYKAKTRSGIRVIFNVFKEKDRKIYEQLLG